MPTTYRIEDLVGADNASLVSEEIIPFSADNPLVFRKVWGLVLLLAIRDRVSSIHYHPWQADGGFALLQENTRYVMVAPPAEFAASMIETARELFTEPKQVSGSVELDVWGNLYLWDAVVWTCGPREGVELFRIAPAL